MMKLSKGVKAVVVVMVITIISVVAFPTQSEGTNADALAPAHPIVLSVMEPTSVTTNSPIPDAISDSISNQRKRSAELTWVRNPFRAPDDAPAAPKAQAKQNSDGKGLQLTGISTINNDKMAIIDRQIVGKGDRLSSGHLVVNVTDDSVDLVLHDSLITLNLEK